MKTLTLIALLAATPALAQPVEVEVDSNRFPMRVGQTIVVRTQEPFRKLAISLPEIADAEATSDHQVLISAKKEGLSSILMYAEDGRAVGMADIEVVIPYSYGRNRVTVWYPNKPHKTYWCAGPNAACEPDPANEEREVKSEMTFILPTPENGNIGRSDSRISVPRR